MAGNFQAVLIGNREFPCEPGLPTLRCPLNDVRGMAELLRAEQHGPYQVSLLEDENHQVIHREVFRALKRAGRDDRVLIYYAGHGKLNDDDRNLYLASRDTTIEDLPASSVAVADIMRYMNNSACKQLILILDCCYSGAVENLLAPTTYRGTSADDVSSTLRGAGGSGSYILTASTSLQRAEEREGDDHGLLTKHVLTGIREGRADRDDDGLISMHELTLYVQDQVRAEGKQTPLCYTLREENGGLIIARTGKAARARKISEVQEVLYSVAQGQRASLRTVRSSLALLVPEASATSEEREVSIRFVDRLHKLRVDIGGFVEVLEEAPALLAAFSQVSSAALRGLEQQRDSALQSVEKAEGLSREIEERYVAKAAELVRANIKLEESSIIARSAAQELAHLRDVVTTEKSGRKTAEGTAESHRTSLVEAGRRLDELSNNAERLAADLVSQSKQLAMERERTRSAEDLTHALRTNLAEAGGQLQKAKEDLLISRTERELLWKKLKAAEHQREEADGLRGEADAKLREHQKAIALERQARADVERTLAPFLKRTAEEAAARAGKSSEELILEVINKYKSDSDFYTKPYIPTDKLNNAVSKCGIVQSRSVLGLVNCTVFGSAKDCLLFDTSAIHWHHLGKRGMIRYSEMRVTTIKVGEKTNLWVNGELINLSGSVVNSGKIFHILRDILALSLPL